ncbi:MAG TPA: choice-of-anchor tandem repeat GloVer-containing protein, partial [Polyangiaceae bacterium]
FLYRVSATGTLETLHTFSAFSSATTPRFANDDGARPLGSLAEDRYHNLYGTTSTGGANGTGTLYQMTRDGQTFVKLYDFPASAAVDGNYPYAGVVVSSHDGSLWGTTFEGGAGGYGTIYQASGPLSFAPITGANLSSVYESAPIRITAIARPTISITNGEYSVNGGPWSSTPDGVIHTGDTLVVRGTSSSALATRVIVAVGFGHQVTSGFTITTRAN